MASFKCKMCGGTIEFEQGATVGVCDSCGTKQTLPRLEDDRRVKLYDRANHFRRDNEFDKAAGIYEQILNEDSTDAETYWSLVLCRYGIEYVEDPATHRRVPTVNRAQFTAIFDDDNYKSALQYADQSQRELYEAEATAINEIQKGILAISQKEEPFDVFICYKETDQNGRRTQDSVLANDLYHQLTQEGFKVFFSRITLEDKLGNAYEPYIFAALNSAKVMVVLGTKPEYFNAVWVKNEWSRYLSLVKQSGGKNVLIPAYRDMDPYDLPEEFSHLQAQDMSKLGFMQDLIRGIKKITKTDEPKASRGEKVAVDSGNANITALLRRAFMFLEDGEWTKADDYCEQVLNIDPENAEAYLGKLMVECYVHRREELRDCEQPFGGSSNYQKVLRFGDEKIKTELKSDLDYINERNENARLEEIYNEAVKRMKSACTEADYNSVANSFTAISYYRDSGELAKQCRQKAEDVKKDEVYRSGKRCLNVSGTNSKSDYQQAIAEFEKIRGWKDADEQIEKCKKAIEELERKEEEEHIARQRAAEKNAKARKGAFIIAVVATVLAVAVFLLYYFVIKPILLEKQAQELIMAGNYDEGYKILSDLGKEDKIASNKYDRAIDLIEEDEYDEAYELLKELGKDEEITSNKNERAIELLGKREYDDAYDLLEELGKDEEIKSSKYDRGITLLESGEYEAAYSLFKDLNYGDSENKTLECLFEFQKKNLHGLKVGSKIKFGFYEQDNNLENGKEEIEWIVLELNNNKALLVSKYALDCQPFEDTNEVNVWWNCSLRKWLNETFIDTAFITEQKDLIVKSIVRAEKNPLYDIDPGKDTKDKMFLLSVNEVQKYFTNNLNKICKATNYAEERGVTINSDSLRGCCFWLRTPGVEMNVMQVESSGNVDFSGIKCYIKKVGVRPAMWIDLSKL